MNSRWLAALFLCACASQGSASDAPIPLVSSPSTTALASASAAAAPPSAPLDPALVERLREDVRRVAVRRDPGSQGWRDVRAFISQRLTDLGYAPSHDAFAQGGVNVIATKPGASLASELVILSAHYDHVWDCAGADDNASGVAVVLEAARALLDATPNRTIMLAFWDFEEDGLVGSTSWAKKARARGDRIEMVISLDGVGYVDPRPGSQTLPTGADNLLPDVARQLKTSGYRGDFIALIADSDSDEHVEAFEGFAASRGLPHVAVGLSALTRVLLLDAARSDHASFWLMGYPGILVTDTANFRNPRYHCATGSDSPDSLDYEFLAKVAGAVIDTTVAAAK